LFIYGDIVLILKLNLFDIKNIRNYQKVNINKPNKSSHPAIDCTLIRIIFLPLRLILK